MLSKFKGTTLGVMVSLAVMFSASASAKYSVESVNATIEQARGSQKTWVDDLVKYPLYLFDISEFKQFSYQLTYDSAELPEIAKINITLSGYLDDSINGEVIYLELKKVGNVWMASEVNSQVTCYPERITSDGKCL